jgi:hypothetical protein
MSTLKTPKLLRFIFIKPPPEVIGEMAAPAGWARLLQSAKNEGILEHNAAVL